MVYGSETRPFLADVGFKVETAEMDVWRFLERQKD